VVAPLIHRPVASWCGHPREQALWRDEPHRREDAYDLGAGPLTRGVMPRGTDFRRVRKGRGVSPRAEVTRHHTPPESLAIICHSAKSMRKLKSMSRGRLDVCDPLLEGLP
jgi:hypothetical protein